jgi:hypothetical protein
MQQYKGQKMPYITRDFPIEFVNAIVHKEVQGKKPIHNLHRLFPRRGYATMMVAR